MAAFRVLACIFVSLLAAWGCSQAPRPVLPTTSASGCERPPADVFTQVGIDVTYAIESVPPVVESQRQR